MASRRGPAISWKHRLHVFLATALLAVVLASCGGGGGTSGPGDGWAQLAPGGSVEGPGGSQLHAPVAAIETPIDVRLARGDVPADELADEGLDALGTAVALTAKERASASSEGGFRLDLPLPSGTDPSTVAVAIYLDGSETAEHVDLAEPGEGPLLEVVEGN